MQTNMAYQSQNLVFSYIQWYGMMVWFRPLHRACNWGTKSAIQDRLVIIIAQQIITGISHISSSAINKCGDDRLRNCPGDRAGNYSPLTVNQCWRQWGEANSRVDVYCCNNVPYDVASIWALHIMIVDWNSLSKEARLRLIMTSKLGSANFTTPIDPARKPGIRSFFIKRKRYYSDSDSSGCMTFWSSSYRGKKESQYVCSTESQHTQVQSHMTQPFFQIL